MGEVLQFIKLKGQLLSPLVLFFLIRASPDQALGENAFHLHFLLKVILFHLFEGQLLTPGLTDPHYGRYDLYRSSHGYNQWNVGRGWSWMELQN